MMEIQKAIDIMLNDDTRRIMQESMAAFGGKCTYLPYRPVG